MATIVMIIIGALIGYLTNYVAIKMIFRPHRQYDFFGFRIPFTPGLIHLRKHDIANNIGLIVEQDLLRKENLKTISSTKLRKYLTSKGIEDKSLLTFMSVVSDNLLEKLIKNISISKMVSDEIMALDTKKLEDMILRISKKEFNYIQYLGAVIGAIIGIMQSLIYWRYY